MSKKWTTKNIPSLNNKLCLVTGANSGLGLGTAKELAAKGAKVVMTARNLAKGDEAVAQIKKQLPAADLELMQLDLADLDNVHQFIHTFNANHDRLDVLINNAGVMMPVQREETQQGFELQFGTNHLGHFVLTAGLLERLSTTANSRIVVVSSLVAKMSKADIYWDDLQFKKSYDKMAAYAQSKLANMMFAKELESRLREVGSQTMALMAHPGYTATNLQQHMGLLGKLGNLLMAQKVDMGILPTLRAATDPQAQGGEYYGPDKLNNFRGYPVLNELNPLANNRTLTQRLWQLSEELTNTHFFQTQSQPSGAEATEI